MGCITLDERQLLTCRKARIFVVTYSVILHLMVFWVIARWGHGPSHHLGGSELQLLCARHVSAFLACALVGRYRATCVLPLSDLNATNLVGSFRDISLLLLPDFNAAD